MNKRFRRTGGKRRLRRIIKSKKRYMSTADGLGGSAWLGEELFTIQRGWRRRDVQCLAEMEVKKYSLFSRLGGEKMFTVQQGWR